MKLSAPKWNAAPDLFPILITDELDSRPPRKPDHAAENRALGRLAQASADPGGDVLTELCDVAMELCNAHTAGISLLEFEGVERVFRWHAIKGKWAGFVGGGLPRNASPCGVVIDMNATQLMHRPGKVFPLVAKAEPELVEALLAPFYVLGQPVGTVWILAHDETRKFDREDARVMERLALFAAAAFTVRDSLDRARELIDELMRTNARINKAVARLTGAGP